MVSDNEPLSEQFRLASAEWVDADSAASMLEELKTATLSQMMLKCGEGLPVNRAEMQVKASEEWLHYLRKMVEARSRANRLKVRLEYLRMRYWEHQSHNATARAEMRL